MQMNKMFVVARKKMFVYKGTQTILMQHGAWVKEFLTFYHRNSIRCPINLTCFIQIHKWFLNKTCKKCVLFAQGSTKHFRHYKLWIEM